MKINSIAIPLPIDNIDTDQIIPARYLKKIDKIGFGEHLFANWRYDDFGNPKETFVLNKKEYLDAQILVAGANFGCGSSREHAAWAIADFGIKAVVSSQFADIFKGNALNNNVIPIELNNDQLERIFQHIENEEATVEVDLESQAIQVGDETMLFEIEPFKKECLIKSMDETAYLLSLLNEIEDYEKRTV